jgi:hypothetical protein
MKGRQPRQSDAWREAQIPGQAQGVLIHLPTGSTMDRRGGVEEIRVTVDRQHHLPFGPRPILATDAILPAYVVPAVDARLEAGIADAAQEVGATPADVRSRQQGTVHQCSESVMGKHRRARHLLHEARTEGALDRAAGVVGTQGEEKGSVGSVTAQ